MDVDTSCEIYALIEQCAAANVAEKSSDAASCGRLRSSTCGAVPVSLEGASPRKKYPFKRRGPQTVYRETILLDMTETQQAVMLAKCYSPSEVYDGW